MTTQHETRANSPGLRLTEVHIFWMAVGAIITYFLSGRTTPPKKADAVMTQVDRAEEDIMDDLDNGMVEFRSFNARRNLTREVKAS